MNLAFSIDSVIIQDSQDPSGFISSRGFSFSENGLEIQQAFDKSGSKVFFGIIPSKARSFIVTSMIDAIGLPYNHSEIYHRDSSFYRNGMMAISGKNDIKINNTSLRNHSRRSSVLLDFDSKSNFHWAKVEGGENTACSAGTVFNGNLFALFGGARDFSLCGNYYLGIQEQEISTFIFYDVWRISLIGLLK